MILYEDKNFKIKRAKDGYVLIRKGKEFNYGHHSHFKSKKGCHIVMKLFHKKLIPKRNYFKTSMKRITTKEEFQQFRYKKKKLSYRNDTGRGRF